MNEVKQRIKAHEGYRLEPYHCTENFLTGGWGHKILDGEEVPTSEEGWSELFDKDFEKALNDAFEADECLVLCSFWNLLG